MTTVKKCCLVDCNENAWWGISDYCKPHAEEKQPVMTTGERAEELLKSDGWHVERKEAVEIIRSLLAEVKELKESLDIAKLAYEAKKVETDTLDLKLTTANENFERISQELDWRESQLEAKDKEIAKIADECLKALAGTACTPVEGYVKAGMNWIASDIRSLVKEHNKQTAEIARLREALGKVAKMDGDSFVSAFAKCVDVARAALKGE